MRKTLITVGVIAGLAGPSSAAARPLTIAKAKKDGVQLAQRYWAGYRGAHRAQCSWWTPTEIGCVIGVQQSVGTWCLGGVVVDAPNIVTSDDYLCGEPADDLEYG